jgi:DNA-binding beta-propeller fold protein YncE
VLLAACTEAHELECGPGLSCRIAGSGEAGIAGEGERAADAMLYLPIDVTVGPDDRVYVMDWNNHRVIAIDDEHIALVAGNGLLGDDTEGVARESSLTHPTNVAFDPEGRLVIAAWHNSRIKRVDLATGRIDTVAGTGERGYDGEGGAAIDAVLDLPAGIVFDPDGNLVFSDQANQVLRSIAPDGTITRYAGRCVVGVCAGEEAPLACDDSDKRYCGDASMCALPCEAGFADGDDARFGFPFGQSADPSARIAIGPDGAIYVADTLNHRVRRVLDGIVTTIAGTGVRGFDGDGGLAIEADLDSPADVAVSADGIVYIADTYSSCVRAIEDGIIRTVAGVCGTRGYAGDGGPAIDALYDQPYGIDVDERGWLYIADSFNHRVRLVRPE